ncbi:MAG TPA: ABATE domain-containing protein, partial [Acidimicrobiia bacterium]|nr:ABATE domain-containing protein [Acidimicrobiia bacterium]
MPIAPSTPVTLAPPPTVQAVEPAELRFRFGTGRLCLDFVATVGERWRRNFDRLRTPTDLGQWIYEGRLLEGRPATTTADLEAARRLRWALYRLVVASIGGPEATPEEVAVL